MEFTFLQLLIYCFSLTVGLILIGNDKMSILRASQGLIDNIQQSSSKVFHQEVPGDVMKSFIQEGMEDLCHFLLGVSPPHLFHLLHDDNFQEIDKPLAVHYRNWTSSIVLKFTPDLGPLRNAITSPLKQTSIQRRHIMVVCSMENVAHIFKMISSENLENPWIWWIVLIADQAAFDTLERLLREGSQVIIIQIIAAHSTSLFVSNVGKDGNIRFSERGMLKKTKKGFVSILSGDLFVELDDLYSDFGGRQLTATANNHKPWISFREESDGELILQHGIDAAIITVIANSLNFTIRMVTTTDKAWGAILPNGTVVGMVGMVHRREAHFASCELTITSSRETVVDFSYPYYIESFTLISQAPKRLQRVLAVFSPFADQVWYGITASVLITSFFLFLLTWVTAMYREDDSEKHTISNILMNVYGSLMLQPNLIVTAYWSVNFTLLFWYLFCLVVTELYASMMTATLVIPSYEKPINSLNDLPDAVANGFTFAVYSNSLSELILKEAKDGLYAQSWQLLNHEDRSKSFIDDPNAGFDEILTDKLIITKGETAARYQAMERGIGQFYFARETFAAQNYGIACFMGSPFQFKFSKILSYMVEGGMIKKWRNDEFLRVAGKAKVAQDYLLKAFNLSQLQAAFYVLILGYAVATLSFTFENLHKIIS